MIDHLITFQFSIAITVHFVETFYS